MAFKILIWSWNGAGLDGAPGHKNLSWLQETGFIQPPWTSLSSKGQIQTAVNQGREGTQRQETLVQPWGRVLVLSQETHRAISLSSSAELSPTKWKMLTTWWDTLHFREGHSAPSSPDSRRSLDWRREGPAHTHSVSATLPLTIKLLTTPPGLGWDTPFWGPCLFNLYAEYIYAKAELNESQTGIQIAGRNISNFRYAGDSTLIVES